MTSEVRATPRGAEGLRDAEGSFAFEPHHCFACGELNEHGLHLAHHTNPELSWIETTLADRFEGWDGVAHGGIVTTILDEVMAWAVIGRGGWGVTARLNVWFRRPIRTGKRILARGWVVEEHRRGARTAGELVDAATGQVLATAEGMFIAIPADEQERMKARYGFRRLAEAAKPADTTDREDERETDELAADALSADGLADARPADTLVGSRP